MTDGTLQVRFDGAAGEVTGSCFRMDAAGARFLVDCGMFQGGREAGLKNAAAFNFDVRALDFVLLTHAHIDHSGLLPRLCARGFRGPVYATPATIDLLGVMLPDSAQIQETEARWAAENPSPRHGRDVPSAPLYTLADAEACLRRLVPVRYDETIAPAPGLAATFRDAGHILGSAIIELNVESRAGTRRLVFSGDLGQPGRPVMNDPTPVRRADVLVVESTYGDRLHKPLATTYDELAGVLSATLPRGNVIIPAFAVGRTQEVLHVLADLVRKGRVPALRIFVDSPLARKASEITARYAATLDRESRDVTGWLAQNPDRVHIMFTQTVEDSMAINRISRGAVVLSASGMCDAGRIKHHLRHNLPRAECAVVITGFQAVGTLGRKLVDGASSVRLFREDVEVRASIHTIGGLSAHADQAALIAWLRNFESPPARAFVVHGERATAEGFAARIRDTLHWDAVDVPARGDSVALG
jgi:metallo-beta-lactamase family protein